MSDIHFEWMDGPTAIAKWIERLPGVKVDVVVLAGDIASLEFLPHALMLFVHKYPGATILVVPGNHEYYGHNRHDVMLVLTRLEEIEPSIVALDRKGIVIKDKRIVGATLWFRPDPRNEIYEKRINDFTMIHDFRKWVYEENMAADKFLRANVRQGDIVVTHYLPSEVSVHRKYKGDELNRFFLCDMSRLIAERDPALWIHGHTHESFDYMLGKTRVVCNPYGYTPDGLNKNFKAAKVIEI